MSKSISPQDERKIGRLLKEIATIEEIFYGPQSERDPELVAGMLERKRDDMVRSVVLQMHTSIESIMDSLIFCAILGIRPEDRRRRIRSERANSIQKMLKGGGSIGFDMKLNLAVSLGILTPKIRDRLVVLNTLRNKCSHNWLLKKSVRRGKRPAQKKPPLLTYERRDLHNVNVIGDFVAEFGSIYVKLWLVSVGD